MASIHIEREHQLDSTQLRNTVQQVVDNLEQEYQLRCEHDGDRVKFSRTGARGQLWALSDKVIIKMELGFLLRPLSHAIHNAIEEQLDQLLN